MKEKGRSAFLTVMEVGMQALVLNLLFLAFCLPVVTIGASLTALYAGLRAMVKKEACFRAFFRTFRVSFLRATLAWLILLPLTALVLINTASILYYFQPGALPALILSLVFCVLLLGITTSVFLFYSRFEATLVQMLRHGGVLYLTYPLRITLIALFTWAPFSLFFVPAAAALLFPLLPVFLFFYFSVVSVAAIWLMNGPFIRFATTVLGMDIPRPDATLADSEQE